MSDLFLLFALACAGGDPVEDEPLWSEPDAQGPYDAAFTTIEFTDARGKELVADVWYPAEPGGCVEPDPYEPTVLTGIACERAEPAAGPWPLVAFSHGFGGIRYQSIYLTERLATHGFVVVAPDHPGNTLLDLDEDDLPRILLERPDDIRYSVDEVLALSAGGDSVLGGLIDGSEYAIVGHSFGAYTSMIVGGGTTDYQGVFDYCEAGGSDDDWDRDVCDMLEGLDPSMADGHGMGDERAVVTVPMSPGIWYAFGIDGSGLADTRRPFVLAGDSDGVLDYEQEALPCYEHMASPKRLATFHATGHYAFSDICVFAPFITDECDEAAAGYIEIARGQEISNTLVTAYLGVELAGDDRFAPWLEPDYTDTIPEITMFSE